MSKIRLASSLLVLGLALGPLGCPSDPVCPTCGLVLRAASKSATLSLSRSPLYGNDELMVTNVTVCNAESCETHQYAPDRLPLVPGQTSRLDDPELYSVGELATVRAEVTMTFRREDASTFTVSDEIPVTTVK
jgi:hypothetical protein